MSTSTASPLFEFFRRSYPSVLKPTISEDEVFNLSYPVFHNISYTDNEKIETTQWLTTSSRLATPDEDEAKHAERLGSLNIHLSTRTTLLGVKPSIADVALFFRLGPSVKTWTAEERTGEHGYHNIVRFIDFVQNAPLFGLSLDPEDKVNIDVDDVKFVQKPIDPKEEKERKKKEKAAAATNDPANKKPLVVGRSKEPESNEAKSQDTNEPTNDPASTASNPIPPKKEKKEKPPKAPKAPKPPAESTPLSPSQIDLRIGHILQAIPHPNADSLYVSTIACGDPPSTPNTSLHAGHVVRTVCSGLNGLIPLADLQNRKIVAVCNLKPVTMRGVKSAAMVLAASPRLDPGDEDTHKGPVELVQVPEGAEAGDRVFFEGWEGEPEAVLNPKKKVWELLQPGFTTLETLEVGFEPMVVEGLRGGGGGGGEGKGEGEGEGKGMRTAKLRTAKGFCTVKSLKNAVVR